MKREVAAVVSNEEAGAGYRLLRLSAPDTCASARPGQFVHLRVPDFDPVALRRPLSICGADASTGVLEILYKIVGRGTEALSRAGEGAEVDLLGPLGNGFPDPDPAACPVLVGGGYGVAPLHFLATRIAGTKGAEGTKGTGAKGTEGTGTKGTGTKGTGAVGSAPVRACRPVLFAGARTAADLLLLDRFEALGVEVRVATDDGSAGAKGRVTAALDAWLASREPDAPPPECFACGPAPMLRAVDERALSGRFPAWLSLDRRMACGVGTCFGCTQTVRDGASASIARVCVDGPVFPSGRIVWDA